MITSKEKAFVGGVVAFIVGLANVLVPFVTSSSVLHYITIGLAVVSFVGVYFGVYQTTNSAPVAKIDPVSPPIVIPAGVTLTAESDPTSIPAAPSA
jgi:hypothetical protein